MLFAFALIPNYKKEEHLPRHHLTCLSVQRSTKNRLQAVDGSICHGAAHLCSALCVRFLGCFIFFLQSFEFEICTFEGATWLSTSATLGGSTQVPPANVVANGI